MDVEKSIKQVWKKNRVLKSHVRVISVDGAYCLTCSSNRRIKLWNPYKGSLLKTYSGHGDEVMDACSSCDSGQIVSCGLDKSVILWDVSTGTPTRRYRGHAAAIMSVKYRFLICCFFLPEKWTKIMWRRLAGSTRSRPWLSLARGTTRSCAGTRARGPASLCKSSPVPRMPSRVCECRTTRFSPLRWTQRFADTTFASGKCTPIVWVVGNFANYYAKSWQIATVAIWS